MDPRRILLIDDDREVRRVLRSTLEMALQDVSVVAVPSAEEALLEVTQSPYDLVITDFNLPGMDGFEFIARVRSAHSDAALIVITGREPAEVTDLLEQFRPDAFFQKPIQSNDLILTVQRLLGEGTEQSIAASLEDASRQGIRDRVRALRADLKADAIFLVDVDGNVVVRAGDVPELDLTNLLLHIQQAFSAAFRVSTMLGGYVPSNMQFFDGDEYDVYVANVGKIFMLMMFFRGERTAQQMSAALLLGGQAAGDLLNLLAQMGVQAAAQTKPEPDRIAAPVDEPAPPTEESAAAPPAAALAAQVDAIEIDFAALSAAAAQLNRSDTEGFWEAALEETVIENTDAHAISYEQARKLGLTPGADE